MPRAKNNSEYLQMVGDVFDENVTGIMRILNNVRKRSATHTDADVEKRISEYFKACMDSAVLPDLASLALSLGVSKSTMEGWARGYNCSEERREIVQRAYTTIEAAQIQATSKGMFNPILFMFLAKSKYGYREDGRVLTLGDRATLEQQSTVAEIEDRYNRPYDVTLPSLEVRDPAPVVMPTPPREERYDGVEIIDDQIDQVEERDDENGGMESELGETG